MNKTIDEAIEAARELGREDGVDAAAWFVQEFVSEAAAHEAAERLLRGYEDGAPEIMEDVPAPDLSGQWADGRTPRSLAHDVGCNDGDLAFYEWLSDELANAYEDGFNGAVEQHIVNVCKSILEG